MYRLLFLTSSCTSTPTVTRMPSVMRGRGRARTRVVRSTPHLLPPIVHLRVLHGASHASPASASQSLDLFRVSRTRAVCWYCGDVRMSPRSHVRVAFHRRPSYPPSLPSRVPKNRIPACTSRLLPFFQVSRTRATRWYHADVWTMSQSRARCFFTSDPLIPPPCLLTEHSKANTGMRVAAVSTFPSL